MIGTESEERVGRGMRRDAVREEAGKEWIRGRGIEKNGSKILRAEFGRRERLRSNGAGIE
jgi:hypothetical protein